MQMDIRCRGFALTDGLRDYAKKRLACSLGHGEAHIGRVIVRLSDINGPRGGEDKSCHLAVRLKGLPEVVIEDTQTDLYLAIDRAAERAGRTLARQLARSRREVPAARLEETASRAGNPGDDDVRSSREVETRRQGDSRRRSPSPT